MNTNHLLIFDLDGTLIDSKLDLVHAANATRARVGLGPLSAEMVASYVGNGAPVLVRKALGPQFSEQEVEEALKYFLTYYWEHMLDCTTVYPGVREALDRLHQHGTNMAVLTNKPVRFSQTILRGLGLSEHFFRVYGGNSFHEKKPSPIGIEALLEERPAPRENTIMVGDSYVDVRTARNAGVRACGVGWGFQPETFEQDPPDILINDLNELADRILAS